MNFRACPVVGVLLATAVISSGSAQTEPAPAGVVAHRDIAYVTSPHERQRLDLFVPDSSDDAPARPIIIWIHGGAWLGGSKEDCPPLRAGFVTRGFAVASLNYRLSRHAVFPAQIEDCKAAIRWLRAHAAEYRLDPARIGVWGSSAGGHLVSLLGTTNDTREFDVGEHLEVSSRVQAVCDFFGPTDFVQMNAHRPSDATQDHDAPDSPESRLVGMAIQLPEARVLVQRANPVAYVSRATAPFLIVHGDHDLLVPHHQSTLLFDALARAEIPVHFITVRGGGHGNGFPHATLTPIVLDFFREQLGPAPAASAAGERARQSTVDAVP